MKAPMAIAITNTPEANNKKYFIFYFPGRSSLEGPAQAFRSWVMRDRGLFQSACPIGAPIRGAGYPTFPKDIIRCRHSWFDMKTSPTTCSWFGPVHPG